MTNLVDLLDLDNKIRKAYFHECHKLDEYLNTEKKILDLLKNDYNLSYRILHDLRQDLNEIRLQIKFIKFFKFYFIETREVLENYIQIIKTPIINSFFKPKQNCSIKLKLISEYTEIIRPYKKILKYVPQECFSAHILQASPTKCENCQSELGYYLDDNVSICCKCFTEKIRIVSVSSFSDNNRINIANKYTYDRKVHFRDCINQYQGKQNTFIPQEVYDHLENALISYRIIDVNTNDDGKIIKNFDKVKLCHIYMVMKNLGYTKFYDDVILIHSNMTGKPAKNIEHLEEQLMQDFDLILMEYTNCFKYLDRKNFNTQYVLFQLLKRHNHPCDEDHLVMLKTNERKLFSDKVCKTIFKKFGWNYTSII